MTAPQPRYFYTDPLAAAWMSEQFGFQFVNDLPQGQQHAFRVVGVTQGWSSQTPFEMRLDFRGERRFYIHTDSLHLLEPQDGDLCSFLWWQLGSDKAAEHHKPYDGSTLSWQRIIQRDGKPFHWPESNAA